MQLLQGKKIILIEDNDFLSDVLARKLKLDGAIVAQYKNGKEGLDALKQSLPDLVLLDIMMPVMNGYELLESLHAENITAKVPIIVVSNSGQPVEIQRVLDLGVRDYIIKANFEPDEVIEKVCKVLNISTTQKTATTDTPAASAQNARQDQQTQAVPTPTPKASSPLKVMIVEDDPLLCRLLLSKLSKSECTCMLSSDGNAAVLETEKFSPDVVLLDLMLPGKDGFQILKELKAHPTLQRIPVFIFSNKSSEADEKMARDLGATNFFVKAMTDLNDLVAILKSSV